MKRNMGRLVCVILFVASFWLPAFGQSVEKLVADLKDSQEDVRTEAARLLAETKDSRAVRPLIAALSDQSPSVRIAAIKALGAIKDPEAFRPLANCLSDDHANVQDYAEMVLKEINDPRTIEPILDALKAGNRVVRASASRILSTISGRAAAEARASAVKDLTGLDDSVYEELLAETIDKNLLVEYAQNTDNEPRSKAASRKLADLHGLKGLDSEHKRIAGQIIAMMAAPAIVKRHGQLRLDYQASKTTHRYREIQDGQPDRRWPPKHFLLERETVRIGILNKNNKRIFSRVYRGREPQRTERFGALGGSPTVDKLFIDETLEATVNLEEICDDLLKGLDRAAIEELAKKENTLLGRKARSIWMSRWR